jgi:hypothetical protein
VVKRAIFDDKMLWWACESLEEKAALRRQTAAWTGNEWRKSTSKPGFFKPVIIQAPALVGLASELLYQLLLVSGA